MPESNTAFYDILGVSPTATQPEIRKAYKRKAIQLHPDRNPAPDAESKFQALQHAYSVLSDTEKRAVYDRHGESGVREHESGGGGGGGGGMDDVIANLFGFGGGGRGSRPDSRGESRKRGEPIRTNMAVQLEQLYNGDTKSFTYRRKRLCTACNGRGGMQVQECSQCDGKGMVAALRQLGPGMYTRMAMQCPACDGKGRQIDPNQRCQTCTGEGLIEKPQQVTVHIERGMLPSDEVVVRGMAHESSDADPGDLLVKLALQDHERFARQKDHLIYSHKLTVKEALLGYDFIIEHLDGRKIRIQSPPGTVTSPDEIKVIHDEGMPVHGTSHHGNLVIKFVLQMPPAAWITDDRRAALQALLPAGKCSSPADSEAAETPTIVPFDAKDPTFDTSRHRQAQAGEAYASDEDRGGGAGGPTCVPM